MASKGLFINDCKNLQEIIFKKYIYRRQILLHLAEDYKCSIPWIRKQIFEYESVKKLHNPRAVVIVCDATFYGKKKDKLGTLVFKDILSGKDLQKIIYNLTSTTQIIFTKKLTQRHEKYKEFITLQML